MMLLTYDEVSTSEDTVSRVVCRRRLPTDSDNVDEDTSSQSLGGSDNIKHHTHIYGVSSEYLRRKNLPQFCYSNIPLQRLEHFFENKIRGRFTDIILRYVLRHVLGHKLDVIISYNDMS